MSNKSATLLTASLAHFFASFMGSAIHIALPAISQDFHADVILLGWMVTSYLIASGVFLIPFGRISDMVGIKKVFLYGICLSTLSSAIAVFSVSAEMLLVLRIIQGIGAAMVMGNTMALITSTFPAKDRGRALGINIAAVYLGLSLGPVLGGLLTEYFGWRSIFAINVPAGMIIILLTILKIKGDWSEKKGEKFDLPGSAIYGLTVTLLMYGFSMLPSLTGAILILGGIIGVLTFIKWENRVSNPMVDIRLFIHNKAFAFSNLAALLNYSATYSVIFLMSLYLQYVKGLSAEKAGLIMITQPIIQAIVTPLAGRLSDKIEPRIVASTGMAITSLGLFLLFGFLNESTSPPQIIAFLLILGLGFALFSSPNTNAIMSSVKPGNYGLAGATMNTMRSTGQMLSMGITMLLFAVYMGPVIIRPEYYPSFLTATKLAFAVSATLCFAGIFASLARGNIRADAGKANGNASTATPATEKGKS